MMNIERYILSETAKRRRKIISIIDFVLLGCIGVTTYILTGLVLRWLGVA